MRDFPYPITVRVLNGYVEVQAPDFGIIRAKKQFDDLKVSKDLGDLILGVMTEVLHQIDSKINNGESLPSPSRPRSSFEINPEDLLTTKEVQRLLQVSHETVRRLANSGELESLRTTGGHRRFKRSDVERFIAHSEENS